MTDHTTARENSFEAGRQVGIHLRALREAEGRERALQSELYRCRATMIRAMNALESDSELDKRREAFEMIQERFEVVSVEDHARAEALIPSLKLLDAPAPDGTPCEAEPYIDYMLRDYRCRRDGTRGMTVEIRAAHRWGAEGINQREFWLDNIIMTLEDIKLRMHRHDL